MVTITEKAHIQVLKLMSESNLNTKTHFLRVGVKGGGCSGLSYKMDFDNKIDQYDEMCEFGDGLRIVIDRKSYIYLFGTELDFSDGLNGKGFNWNNPQASRTCGCGESFAV